MFHHSNFFVIVNYNSGKNIITCIESIMHTKGIDMPTIVIVDNASRDNSLESCKARFPKNIYIYNTHNIGFSAAANIGIRYALERGAYTITLCNPDATLTPQCLKNVLHTLTKTQAGIVSPIIYKGSSDTIWFDGGFIDFTHMRAIHKRTALSDDTLAPHSYISGCVMTIRADVFEKIGLFDERFFLYYEDADFSLRAQEHGFSLAIAQNAYAYHTEVSEQNKEMKTYFLVLSGLLFFGKHTKGIRALYFYIHYRLRTIKNYFARKKNKPFAQAVHKAFIDYAQKK